MQRCSHANARRCERDRAASAPTTATSGSGSATWGQTPPGGARPRLATAWRRTRGAWLVAAAVVAAAGAARALQDVELLERAAGADCHARERRLGDVDRHLGLAPQA